MIDLASQPWHLLSSNIAKNSTLLEIARRIVRIDVEGSSVGGTVIHGGIPSASSNWFPRLASFSISHLEWVGASSTLPDSAEAHYEFVFPSSVGNLSLSHVHLSTSPQNNESISWISTISETLSMDDVVLHRGRTTEWVFGTVMPHGPSLNPTYISFHQVVMSGVGESIELSITFKNVTEASIQSCDLDSVSILASLEDSIRSKPHIHMKAAHSRFSLTLINFSVSAVQREVYSLRASLIAAFSGIVLPYKLDWLMSPTLYSGKSLFYSREQALWIIWKTLIRQPSSTNVISTADSPP
jgi:hypothetical protein